MRTKTDQVQNLPITTKIINKLYSTFTFSVSAVHFVILLMLLNKKLRQRPADKFLSNLYMSDGIVCISFMFYVGHLLEYGMTKKSLFESYFML